MPVLFALLVLLIAAPAAVAGYETRSTWQLPSDEDQFYKEYGGRVYRLHCPDRQVFVWKRADGKDGWFHCKTGRTSKNAKIVIRRDGKWIKVP